MTQFASLLETTAMTIDLEKAREVDIDALAATNWGELRWHYRAAIAEIERLRAENEDLKRGLEDAVRNIRQQCGTIASLRAQTGITWQVTEERKAALGAILEYISYDAHDDIEICGHAAVLQAMLQEAEAGV